MKKHLAFMLFMSLYYGAVAQQTAIDSSKYSRPKTWTAVQDQANMMQQLGIKTLRPGPSGKSRPPTMPIMMNRRPTPARSYPKCSPQKMAKK